MILVGMDISRQSTGVAIGDGSGPPSVFRARFEGSTPGQIGWNYQQWLRALLILHKPDVLCAEAAFVGKTDNLHTATLMLGLSFLTQTTCEMRSVEYHSVACQTWRKAFLGTGRPENPKGAAIAMCGTLGWEIDGNHDKAEACGIWCYAHLNHGNHKAMWRVLSGAQIQHEAASQ